MGKIHKLLIKVFVILIFIEGLFFEDPKVNSNIKVNRDNQKNTQINQKDNSKIEIKQEDNGNNQAKKDSNIAPEIGKRKSDIVDSFSKEWSSKMLDYESQYVYMIPVPYKQPQIFYENITNVPCRVRGAYILDDQKGVKLDFKILSPDKKEVYKNNSAAAIFDFEIKEAGLYSIVFSNFHKTGEIKPTFTMNTGQNRIAQTKDLANAENNMEILANFLKSFKTEDKLKRSVIRERRIKLQKSNNYFYTFSIIESIVLVIVSVWQFYYMKNLFEIKGSL